jgi:hypothetical protein
MDTRTATISTPSLDVMNAHELHYDSFRKLQLCIFGMAAILREESSFSRQKREDLSYGLEIAMCEYEKAAALLEASYDDKIEKARKEVQEMRNEFLENTRLTAVDVLEARLPNLTKTDYAQFENSHIGAAEAFDITSR